MAAEADYTMLKETARRIRCDIIREVFSAGSGHPGGSLSAADILTTLYFHQMKIDPADPEKKGRDRFVLSKGHAAPVLYASLAERGYFPVKDLTTLRKIDSFLQGHPDMNKVPGVEMSTGSLGQGSSAAVGMAIAMKHDNDPGRVFILMGDGEIQEGIIWESAMAASHYKLDNICAVLDWNGLQIDGKNEDVMTITPVDEKFKSFGWNVIMADGHDFNSIISAFEQAEKCKGKPSIVIAKTVKGKGVSFMENDPGWHGKAPDEEQAKQAISELGGEW